MSSREIEIEGKTIEEAIKKALKIFKVSREKLKIEIITEEEKGLFGMPGGKPAKIKVCLKEDSEKAKSNS